MPDLPPAPSRRRRSQRWWWLALTAAGLAGAITTSQWLGHSLGGPLGEWVAVFRSRPLADQQDVLIAAASLLVSIVGVLVGVLFGAAQVWQGRRAAQIDRQSRHLDRNQAALDRLHAHLGRRTLPRMGGPATRGVALRVHQAIPLPDPPPTEEPTTEEPTKPRWYRLLPHRWRPHPASASGLDPDLPLLVSRDLGLEMITWMQEAASSGGFLLLVGDSSVGKTRLLYETARRELPDFWVLAPDLGDGDLVNFLAEASFGLPPLIVWLDELHRFLDGPYLTPGSTPITAGTLGRLLDAPTPVVVLGSMWPEHAARLRSTIPSRAGGQPPEPRYPNAADVLNDRRCHQLTLITFSKAERAEAGRLAPLDPRLAEALADQQYNVTEALAGAPQLMRRYQQATPEQQAVLHAAIDARRLGVQAPLTSELLKDAARGYLTCTLPDDTWFPAILAELVRAERATAPLLEAPNPNRSAVVGYTVADYLLQHASAQRRSVRLPAATWDALVAHIHERGDVSRLTRSAHYRRLYCYTEPLWRRAANAGDTLAARRLAALLEAQGRVEEAIAVLRSTADAGDFSVGEKLVQLLAEHGDEQDLRARADTHDDWAAKGLADRLKAQGREEELRVRAGARDIWAANSLVALLEAQGRVEEAIAVLRPDAGDPFGARRLADLLARHGRDEEAIAALRPAARDYQAPESLADLLAYGRGDAARTLADLLAKRGREEEAIAVLRPVVDAGTRRPFDALQLADLLNRQGRVEEAIAVLRPAADVAAGAGRHYYAATRLADLLKWQGRVEEAIAVLRPAAAGGDGQAAERLAALLGEHGREQDLRALADAGSRSAAASLVDWLKAQGREEDLRVRADAGDSLAARRLADLLEAQGRVEEAIAVLRPAAAGGDWQVAERLFYLVKAQDRDEELRALADAGNGWATSQLVLRLELQGRVEEAIAALRRAADADDFHARLDLIDLLGRQGRDEELRVLADAGYELAAERLAALLAKQGRDEELRIEVDAGCRSAAERLIELLVKQGKAEQAGRLRRFGLNPDGSIADAPARDRDPQEGIRRYSTRPR